MVTVHVLGTPRVVDGCCSRCGATWRGDAIVVRPVAEGLSSFVRCCTDCAPLLAKKRTRTRTRR
jgi:hypothetical protein